MKKKFALFKKQFNQYTDPWGLDLSATEKAYKYILPIYNNYFKVRCFGLHNIKPKQQYLFVSNHSGQVAVDGVMIAAALIEELKQPILIRPLVDRFVPKLPWIGEWMSSVGAIVGNKDNCLALLKRQQSALIFPEGTKGLAKSSSNYYQLKSFTQGFAKIASMAEVKIIPIALVGAEEMFPFVYQNSSLNRFLKLPTLPISLCYFPLPSPIDIYFGKAYTIKPGTVDVKQDIFNIKNIMQDMINKGLKKRRNFAFTYNKSKDL
ncbi:MAG: hypothetical protein HAW63_02680 [Bdellovibrionaceae bacterium]|nr:hypothetical protein [Pseudobdellovibrionaceae bacterium]